MRLKDSLRDCKECINCQAVRGFMCTCSYQFDDGIYHHSVNQDVSRVHANKCAFYTVRRQKGK